MIETKPKIKLCGQTRIDDVRFSFDSGADFCGVVIEVPSSPRTMTINKAVPIFDEFGARLFALTANAPQNLNDEIARKLKPGYFQLTADETPEVAGSLRKRLGIPVFKSIHIRANGDHKPEPTSNSKEIIESIVKSIELYADNGCDGFVLDSKFKGMYGGTGIVADWGLASEIIKRLPNHKIFLAGGLSPDNIATAIKVKPYGLDLASGVETSPGVKSEEKIRELFLAINGS
jgi:phosphoribosylanthranilate isomerase